MHGSVCGRPGSVWAEQVGRTSPLGLRTESQFDSDILADVMSAQYENWNNWAMNQLVVPPRGARQRAAATAPDVNKAVGLPAVIHCA